MLQIDAEMKIAEQKIIQSIVDYINLCEKYGFCNDEYETKLLSMIGKASNDKIKFLR